MTETISKGSEGTRDGSMDRWMDGWIDGSTGSIGGGVAMPFFPPRGNPKPGKDQERRGGLKMKKNKRQS